MRRGILGNRTPVSADGMACLSAHKGQESSPCEKECAVRVVTGG